MFEIYAVIFTLLSVWFTRKQNIIGMIMGVIAGLCYYMVFYKDNCILNLGLQVV